MVSPDRILRKIKSLQIQGAKEIAVESLKFLKNYTREYGFGRKFENTCKKLEQVRPTAVVLHNCLKIIRQEKKIETIDGLLKLLETATQKIKKLSKIIKPGSTLMTHCHSGEALAFIKSVKRVRVIATETRPRGQGIKTAKELVKAGISTTLITDAAAGFFMPEVDMVVVGTDALRREGVVNKIGTYALAVLAKEHKKQFYVVGNTLKFDRRKEIIIEERPPSEVYKNLRGVKIRNPAFDITPWKYVTKVITEKGVFSPKDIKRWLDV